MVLLNGEEFIIKNEFKKDYLIASQLSLSENTISLYCIKENNNDLILLIDLETHEYRYIPINILEEKNNKIIKYFMEKNIISNNFNEFKILYNKDYKLEFDIDDNILYIKTNVFIRNKTYLYNELKEKTKESSKPTFNNYKMNVKNEHNTTNLKHYIPHENNEILITDLHEIERLLNIEKNILEADEEIYNNKLLSNEEKIEILNQILEIDENSILINVVNKDLIITVNLLTGKISKTKYRKLLNEKTQLTTIDNLLKLINIQINTFEDVENVTCCDIRLSYKYYKNKNLENDIVKSINYVIENNTMYLSIVDDEIVKKGISFKEYSTEIYNNKELQFSRKKLLQELEKYGTKIIYLILEEKTIIAKTFTKEDTFEEINFEELYSIINKPNIKNIFELCKCFPIENIINLAEFNINSFEKIKHSNKKIINMCDPKVISEDDDELSYGFDRKSNTLFYFINEY